MLDPAVVVEGVPHVTMLNTGDKPWVESMNEWLQGKILTEEAARYIRNFLCVNRMRSRDRDDDVDCRSDDIISDEELELSKEELTEALETRIGGKQPGQKTRDIDNHMEPEELSHFENSSSAIGLAQAVWGAELTGGDQKAPRFPKLPKCLTTVFKAARDSQRMDPWSGKFQAETRKASLEVRALPKMAEADAWLAKVKAEVNGEQFDVINQVVQRVLVEEREKMHPREHTSDPLLHLMHGRPGVGKSHVLKELREFFEEVMKWTIGVEFNIVALQAVMATALGGETLHHVAGINPFASEGKSSYEQHMSSVRLSQRH